MKNIIRTIIPVLIFCIAGKAVSQNLNWVTLKPENKHIVSLNLGIDYGMVYGAGYSYQVKSKLPMLLSASVSFPSGDQVIDDFKTRIGGQVRVYQVNHFQFSASLYSIYRRFENPLVRLQNFGSEMNGVAGYYRQKWFVAAEVGFDKAIVTHFKHSQTYRDFVYADVKDGWYTPASGGNFNYGIQGGYSFNNCDVTLKFGKLVTQDFKTTPMFPMYTQLGFNYRFGS